MQINKKLLPMKGHYFFFNAGTAPVVPFMTVYAKNLGYSSVIVGFIYMVMPVAGMLAKPLMGALADRYKCQKLIFLVAQLITAVAFLMIFYVPAIPSSEKVHFSCDNGLAVFDTCLDSSANMPRSLLRTRSEEVAQLQLECSLSEKHWSTVCNEWKLNQYCSGHPETLTFEAHVPFSRIDDVARCIYFEIKNSSIGSEFFRASCPTPEDKISSICDVRSSSSAKIDSLLRSSFIEDEEVVKYYQFWLFVALMVISWVGQAVVVSVGDAICFELLEDKPSKYGQQRSFGALGWGLFSVLSGFMVDNFGNGGERNYLAVFYLAFGVLLVDFVTSTQIKYVQKSLSTTILKDVSRLLTNVRILVFFIWCIGLGMCTGLMWNFLLWRLEEMGASYSEDYESWITTLEGIVMATQCLGGELPFFFLSSWILKRTGHVHAMTLILAVVGVRFILYSVITNPWFVLPVEFLNGITFGLGYASMASYAAIIAPPGTATTVQGLTGAVFEGVGVSVGSLLGGVLFDRYHGALTFRIFGIGSLIVCLAHALVQYLIGRSSPSQDFTRYATPQDALSMVEEYYQELHTVSR